MNGSLKKTSHIAMPWSSAASHNSWPGCGRTPPTTSWPPRCSEPGAPFWLGYSLLTGLIASGRLTAPAGAFPEMAFWFVAVAAITWIGTVAATRLSSVLAWVFGLFALASTLAAIAIGFGLYALSIFAGWMFVIGSGVAWYGASAMLLNATFGREVLPVAWSLELTTPPRGVAGHAPEGTAARRVS